MRGKICWVLPLLLASTGVAMADTDVTVYGYLDLSVDGVDQGLKTLPAVTSNSSYIGFGAQHDLTPDWKVVGQVETEADVAMTPSTKGSLGFRNSFLGFASKTWGALKAGKNDTPYKIATAPFDPFANTVGDYNSIVGNTGGDNRVEFDARLPHAVWYESPALGPVTFSVLWSPGQNLAGDNSDFPLGEQLCSGSTPGSSGSGTLGSGGPIAPTGASGFGECNDGSFGDAYSGDVVFKSGGLLAIAAGELHHAVNRNGDNFTAGGVTFTSGTHTEYAAKVGAGYNFGLVKVYALAEMLRRTSTTSTFNERSHNTYYGSASWRFLPSDELSFAYGRAMRTPGNPGVANCGDPGSGTGNFKGDDAADLFALGVRHYFTPAVTMYLVGALDHNHKCAHYGLGESGHGIGYLSRGATNETFTGKDISAISLGATFRF